jgi:hypothetical protein
MVGRRTSRVIDKKVIYPVFTKCAEFTLDRFYIDIFNNCARGDFPNGSRVGRGSMYIIAGKNKFKTVDLSIDPKELYSLIIRHFRDDLNLCSSHETKKVLETYDKLLRQYNEQKNEPWSKWSKQMKCDGIIEYVFRISRKKSLTDVQRKRLFTTINRGLMFKCIQSMDIKCKNGKITHIDGIYEKRGDYYYRPRSFKESTEPSKKQVTLAVLWATYINAVSRKYMDLRKA